MEAVEVRVSDVKKWAGREETVRLVEAWPKAAWERVDFPLVDPGQMDVVVRNAGGGTLLVNIQGTVKAQALCSRCVEPFDMEMPFEAVEEFREEALPNDPSLEYSRFTGDVIVLDELVSDAVGLSFPISVLCRPDCQGLCPQCGTNWNQESCSCVALKDERWAQLGRLLVGDPLELEREKDGRS